MVALPCPDPSVRNRLLSSLSRDDFALLRPRLIAAKLKLRDVVIAPGEPIEQLYFPEEGILSVVAVTAGDHRIEVGLIGREGMSGTAILLHTDRTPHEVFVQVPGDALRVAAADLRAAVAASPSLNRHLLRYVQTLGIQVACTALANGRLTIQERLARWILMCHDRVSGDEFATTHRCLALMLGANRPGVTQALHTMEATGSIVSRRNRLIIRDRHSLEAAAGASYGLPEAEYVRLIGPFRQSKTA